MQMPHMGDSVRVRATVPNVERIPCSGRFFAVGEVHDITVTPHIASRLRDGALVLVPAPAPAAPQGDQ